MLAAAVDAVTRPLPPSRPLWRALVLTGMESGGIPIVTVLHHVLADGIGGLAILRCLVDGADPLPTVAPRHFAARRGGPSSWRTVPPR